MMIFYIATSFLVFSAEAEACDVDWCCPGDVCHAINATGSVDDDSCICECAPGYFNWIDEDIGYLDTSCPFFCGDHGTAFTEPPESSGLHVFGVLCDCDDGWRGWNDIGEPRPCDVCEDPYQISDDGLSCAQCDSAYEPSSYPECNVCADGYFKNPWFIERTPSYNIAGGYWGLLYWESTMCLPISSCGPALCNFGVEPEDTTPWSPNMQVVNGTCDCKCNEGYHGEPGVYKRPPRNKINIYYSDSKSCQYCGGKGLSFNQETEQCTACETGWEAEHGCLDCSMYVGGENCDRCVPPHDGWKQRPYPDCSEYISVFSILFSFRFPMIILWVSFALASIGCTFAIWHWKQIWHWNQQIWHWNQQRRKNKSASEGGDPELGETHGETEKMAPSAVV